MIYTIEYDITYLDGALTGLVISQTTPFTSQNAAERHLAFLSKVEADSDFIRACVTENRYQPSNVVMMLA